MENKKLYYSLFYAIIGNVIGYSNGIKNFNEDMRIQNMTHAKHLSNITLHHIFNFIAFGGYSNYPIKKFTSSGNVILLLAVFDAIKKSLNKSNNYIIKEVEKQLISYYKKYKLNRDNETYYYDKQTIKSLERLYKKNLNWNNFHYSENAIGNTASIRSIPIGLFYYGKKNRDKLLEISIQTSRITHNNPTGYLGGFASALFTALAMEKINPTEWIEELLSFFSNGKIKNFIKTNIANKFKNELKYHYNDIDNFFFLLMKYREWRFEFVNKKYIFIPASNDGQQFIKVLDFRNFLFFQKFSTHGYYNPGSNGLDSLLIAYDSILECDGNFEKLIYYSMLHAGDSDATGCIAAALFGAYYGNVNLPHNLTLIDLQDQLDDITNN